MNMALHAYMLSSAVDRQCCRS